MKSLISEVINQEAQNNTAIIMTLDNKEAIINNFLNFLDVSINTANAYRKALKQLFNYFNNYGVDNPNRDNILAFKKEMESKGRKPSTIALYLAASRRFFSMSDNLMETNSERRNAPAKPNRISALSRIPTISSPNSK